MKKCLLIILLIFVMMSCFSVPVLGEELPQIDRDDCSLSVILQDRITGEGITDATLTCVRVGYIESDNGPYKFFHVLTDEVIGDVESVNAAEDFQQDWLNYADQFETYEVTSVAKDGTYHFSDMKTGVYLVVQEKSAKGYGTMHPFLVTLPYNNNGEYLYHVTADAKTQLLDSSSVSDGQSSPPTGDKLPQTGQLYWPIPLLVAAGLAFIVLGWVLGQTDKASD